MFALVTSLLAFVLFYIYDFNSVLWRNSLINKFFAIGTTLFLLSFIFIVFSQIDNVKLHWLSLICSLAFLALLIHTLFFAIPFKETYIKDEQNRLAYTKGMYALCRHPGVLWLLGLTLSLYTLFPTTLSLFYVGLVNGLNYAYIVLQDVWTFPNTFTNYTVYKTKTPFLIPNIRSFKEMIHHNAGGLYESEK